MKWTKWRLLGVAAISILVAGLVLAGWFVDKMALSYLTGQRRVPGKDWFGNNIRMDGPSPGYVFLGFSQPSDEPPGFFVVRPSDSGLEIGLEKGDRRSK